MATDGLSINMIILLGRIDNENRHGHGAAWRHIAGKDKKTLRALIRRGLVQLVHPPHGLGYYTTVAGTKWLEKHK